MTISKLLLGCAFATVSLAANAADLPRRTNAIAPAPVASSWTGFYVGATAGYNFFTKVGGLGRPNGANLGLRAGYDYQIAPSFVIGALVDGEIDFGSKSIAGTFNNVAFTGNVKQRYTASVDLKAGYILNDQTMIYAVGGFTHVEGRATATVAGASASQNITGNGWNVGVGAEYRFTKQWSGFAEYRFNEVKKNGATIDFSQVKLGVAYRF